MNNRLKAVPSLDPTLKHQLLPTPTADQEMAADAVRKTGTNVLPILIETIQRGRAPLRLRFPCAPPVAAELNGIPSLRWWYRNTVMQAQGDVLAWRAALGIEALCEYGPLAKQAVPALLNLRSQQGAAALEALRKIDPDAISRANWK
ncbi:MAG: hypothetical protein O2960_19975 [Verrucomicrobia bacterium]|nr:hypothetical protein [Verrucomicrobiota bacterium]